MWATLRQATHGDPAVQVAAGLDDVRLFLRHRSGQPQ